MNRQKVLLAIVGILLLAQIGDWTAKYAIRGPMQRRRARTVQLQRLLKQRKQQYDQLRNQLAKLREWESRSLPRNPDIARSLYRAWLLDLTTKLRFGNRQVDAGSPANHRGLYWTLAFTVRGRTTMQRLLDFLYQFYTAPHLHQIRTLNLVPVQGSEQVDALIGIECMILPTADRQDRLASGKINRLAFQWPDDYRVILDRNFFGFKQSAGPSPADLIVLTAITSTNGQPEAWLMFRQEDRVVKLRVGDKLVVGPVTGEVVEIADRDVVLELEGERWLLTVGDRLSDATALPPGL